ncbi:uncharacterized protein [Procambarus clarkii]|uniref:uncharacterized protein n=1 Tax=Procambarus clarkii TaxID=6728 RepID=UPI003743E175
MEKVEKKLTRFRATLKNKRKLSLPVFINQFQQQWAEQQAGPANDSGGGLEVGVASSSGSSFGSLTSIPPVLEKESRLVMSPTNLNLAFQLDFGKERLSSSGGGSPYSTLGHTSLVTSVSSPGGTTQLVVAGTPSYPTVRLNLPDGSSSRQDSKSDLRSTNEKVSVEYWIYICLYGDLIDFLV